MSFYNGFWVNIKSSIEELPPTILNKTLLFSISTNLVMMIGYAKKDIALGKALLQTLEYDG